MLLSFEIIIKFQQKYVFSQVYYEPIRSSAYHPVLSGLSLGQKRRLLHLGNKWFVLEKQSLSSGSGDKHLIQ